MAQPQQQTTQNQPAAKPEFTPDASTYWFVQPVTGIEIAAQAMIVQKYGGLVGRVQHTLDVRRLNDRHTIIPVFVDNSEPLRDAAGKVRKRVTAGPDRDPLSIRFGQPIRCADFATTDDDMGNTTVQVTNLKDEDGRVVKGLLTRVSDACMVPGVRKKANGDPVLEPRVRARYSSENHTIQLTDL